MTIRESLWAVLGTNADSDESGHLFRCVSDTDPAKADRSRRFGGLNVPKLESGVFVSPHRVACQGEAAGTAQPQRVRIGVATEPHRVGAIGQIETPSGNGCIGIAIFTDLF